GRTLSGRDDDGEFLFRRSWLLTFMEILGFDGGREDDGVGWPGLRLRADLVGTKDGLAKTPYIRESRRIKSQFTVREEHVGRQQRALATRQPVKSVKAAEFFDSVGVGSYHIDLHPSSGGDNYIDMSSLRFQIPLGALLPIRVRNLLPACKNIGTTHVTNGCYRLHPVEWNLGETAGLLAAFCRQRTAEPSAVREQSDLLADFQALLVRRGVELQWS
ncbi:MAG: FAD-dependent oxidoreductase, partial [Planctomycetota bacterium]